MEQKAWQNIKEELECGSCGQILRSRRDSVTSTLSTFLKQGNPSSLPTQFFKGILNTNRMKIRTGTVLYYTSLFDSIKQMIKSGFFLYEPKVV